MVTLEVTAGCVKGLLRLVVDTCSVLDGVCEEIEELETPELEVPLLIDDALRPLELGKSDD